MELIVRALVGDSTTTSANCPFPRAAPVFGVFVSTFFVLPSFGSAVVFIERVAVFRPPDTVVTVLSTQLT
jgi:hypothetical protein